MIKKSDNNVRILIMSIVGIDKENDFDYYKIKYEQELIGPEILSLEEMVKTYINKFNKYSYKIIILI